MILQWNGDKVELETYRRIKWVLDEGTKLAVMLARDIVPVDTGNLRESIGRDLAKMQGATGSMRLGYGRNIIAQWGANWNGEAPYWAFVELGTVHMHGRFYLRRTADVVYPLVSQNIPKAKGTMVFSRLAYAGQV